MRFKRCNVPSHGRGGMGNTVRLARTLEGRKMDFGALVYLETHERLNGQHI